MEFTASEKIILALALIDRIEAWTPYVDDCDNGDYARKRIEEARELLNKLHQE